MRVWAAFWGMSPELCSGLAIHCPPLHNGQNHTTMRLNRGRIPGMLKYRARHSPLPLTENTQMLNSPSPFPHPWQWREEQHWEGNGERLKGWSTGEGEQSINKWCSGSGRFFGKDYHGITTSTGLNSPTYDCNFCNVVSLGLIFQACLAYNSRLAHCTVTRVKKKKSIWR